MENMIESFEDYDYRAPVSEGLLAGTEYPISVYNEDITTLPHKSRLIISGKVTVFNTKTVTAGVEKKEKLPLDKRTITMINNGIMNLWDRIDYFIADHKIDSIRKPGISTTMKGLVSFESDMKYNDAGWKISLPDSTVINGEGFFSLTIPLSNVMGFFEDYTKMLYRIPQKLVFHRSTASDNNIFYAPNQEDSIVLQIKDIIWRMPQIKFNIEYETRIRKDILNGTNFEMKYRRWLYQSIPAPSGTEFTWDIPTAYSKTKFILLAFQKKNRENKLHWDNSQFDLTDLENVQVLLNNNIYYPRERLNLKMSENKMGKLYHMYKMFKASYYSKDENEVEPLIDYNTFIEKYPIIAIDCSYQPSVIKESLINIKISFSWRKEIEENSTTIHCIMIFDDKSVYNPLYNRVTR